MEWRLFADLAERAGARRVPVGVTAGATVEEALTALLDAHPALSERVVDDGDLASSVTLLHNGEPVTDLDTRVSGGDELALLPPASGG
jgi:molybdopterin synthase sulfur carrier subunit